jgi:hypothetical protein
LLCLQPHCLGSRTTFRKYAFWYLSGLAALSNSCSRLVHVNGQLFLFRDSVCDWWYISCRIAFIFSTPQSHDPLAEPWSRSKPTAVWHASPPFIRPCRSVPCLQSFKFSSSCYYMRSLSSVLPSYVTITWATGLTARIRFPTVHDFSLLHSVQTGPGVHPAFYPMGTGGSFPGPWSSTSTSSYVFMA